MEKEVLLLKQKIENVQFQNSAQKKAGKYKKHKVRQNRMKDYGDSSNSKCISNHKM